MDATVAVVRTRPETVLEDYRRLLRLARLDEPPTAGAFWTCALLLARSGGRRSPAETCPPWQVEGVVRSLLAAGWPAEDLAAFIPVGTTRDRGAAAGWSRVLAGCGVVGGLETTPAAQRLPGSLVLSGLYTSRRLGVCGALAALAAHVLTPEQEEELDARPGTLAKAWPEPAGAVVDVTVCGDGPDVGCLQPVAAHVLLAGRDPVAVDAMAAVLVGHDPRRLPLTASLGAAGLGCADPTRIGLVGDQEGVAADLHLREPAAFRGPRHQEGPGWLRRLTARFPGTWTGRLSGRHGRQRYETLPWGRLEREYDRRGVIGGDEA